jgi:hypothetical protein
MSGFFVDEIIGSKIISLQIRETYKMLQFIAINCYYFGLTLCYDKGTYHRAFGTPGYATGIFEI